MPIGYYKKKKMQCLIFSLCFLWAEVHWIWRFPGAREEGPAEPSGKSGITFPSAGAEDQELCWSE